MIELEQYAQDINGIRKSILAAGEALHIDHMREQIDELTEEMNQPEFWNDTERSTRVNQKLGHLKNKLEHYEKLLGTADDIDTMMELAKEENDEDMVLEVGTELASLDFDEPIQDISANGAYLAVLTAKGLQVYDSRLHLCLSENNIGYATRVCVQRDGAALLIDGSSARRIS